MKNQIKYFVVCYGCACAMSALAENKLGLVAHENVTEDVGSFIESIGDNASLFPIWYRDASGKAVFETLPVAHLWRADNGNGNWGYPEIGQFLDLNGDGLPDYIVSYFEPNQPEHSYYRATFLNNGKGWVMQACRSNIDFNNAALNLPASFAACQ